MTLDPAAASQHLVESPNDWCPEETARTTILSAEGIAQTQQISVRPDPVDGLTQLLIHPMHGYPDTGPVRWQVVTNTYQPDGSGILSFSHLTPDRATTIAGWLLTKRHLGRPPKPDHMRNWSGYKSTQIRQTLLAHGLVLEANLIS